MNCIFHVERKIKIDVYEGLVVKQIKEYPVGDDYVFSMIGAEFEIIEITPNTIKLSGHGIIFEVIDDTFDEYFQTESSVVLSEREREIYKIANNVLYFNDRSDYMTALYEILKALNPNFDPYAKLEYIE